MFNTIYHTLFRMRMMRSLLMISMSWTRSLSLKTSKLFSHKRHKRRKFTTRRINPSRTWRESSQKLTCKKAMIKTKKAKRPYRS